MRQRLEGNGRGHGGRQFAGQGRIGCCPRGVGIAVSSVTTVSTAKDSLRDKTAAQIIAEVRATLLSLGVPEDIVNRLNENRNYTPADLLIMARALKQLNAQNTTAFVEHAAEAKSRNVAFYQRRRAQILAARSNELGGVVLFVTFGGQPMNVARNGSIIAAFQHGRRHRMDGSPATNLHRRHL